MWGIPREKAIARKQVNCLFALIDEVVIWLHVFILNYNVRLPFLTSFRAISPSRYC